PRPLHRTVGDTGARGRCDIELRLDLKYPSQSAGTERLGSANTEIGEIAGDVGLVAEIARRRGAAGISFSGNTFRDVVDRHVWVPVELVRGIRRHGMCAQLRALAASCHG